MRTLRDIFDSIPKETFTNIEWNLDDNKFNNLARISARCNLDFPFFAEHVLGTKMSQFHKEPVKYIYNERQIVVIWPRGHLKTTIWAEAYPIWRMWKERGIEIAITSSALEQSQKVIEEIENKIAENEFLKGLVPKNRMDSWNKSQLNTENKNKLYQKPFNSTSRGTHVDYLILDDILREENLSQEQIKDYFWSIFYPTTQTRMGQILVVGTPMTTKDLMAELKEKADWKTVQRACVTVDDNGKWLKPLWPERFTLEELKKIKDTMGSLRFEREYMTNPLGGGASIFKNIKDGAAQTEKPFPNEEYFMGIDVAMSKGAKADFTVFSILGRNNVTSLIKQRKMERFQGWNEEQMIERITQLNKRFKMRKIMIENIGLSIGLVKKLKTMPLPIEGFVTNAKGKEELISSISVGFETDSLQVLDNTIQYNELIGFKAKEDPRSGKTTYEGVGEHDDTVIALGLAMLAIEGESKGSASLTFI